MARFFPTNLITVFQFAQKYYLITNSETNYLLKHNL